jgi:endonuclease/exonuclease/phosphatase family metal-dependent hydrolase
VLVATYNAHRGRGPFRLFDPRRIVGVIAEIRPDLIALQEAQHYLRRRVPMLDAEALADQLGLRLLRVQADQQGWRGNLLLVRHDARVLRPPEGLRIGGMEPRGAILAELDLGQGPFRVMSAHLSLGAGRRRLQAAALLVAMRGGAAMPTLLLGDLNEARADGAALEVLRPVFGPAHAAPTFPSFRPILALDRIMGHPAGLVPAVAAHDSPLARIASDHLPLTARIDTRLLAV